MKPIYINRCRSARLPRRYFDRLLTRLSDHSRFRRHRQDELVIVFVDASEMKKINHQYRGKNYATDVLSFEPSGESALGELVLCPTVLREHAKRTKLSYRQELAYMVIHGCLHLLGYDHEKNEREAKQMFRIQDDIFEGLKDV